MLLNQRHRAARAARPRRSLTLEALESRLAPATGPFDTPYFTANNALLSAAYDVPQMSLALTTPDGAHTYTATYSSRDYENPATLDASTLFRIGSISKTFSAVALLKLVELTANSADPIRLTDSALSRLPVAEPTASTPHYAVGTEIAGYDPAFGPGATEAQSRLREGQTWFNRVSTNLPAALFDITIADMLSMTSGLPTNVQVNSKYALAPLYDQVIYTDGSYAALQFAYGDGLRSETPTGRPADVYQQIRYYLYAVSSGLFNPDESGGNDCNLQPPGMFYCYNDVNFAFAGAIVDAYARVHKADLGLTHGSYADFLQTYILGPMGIDTPSANPTNPAIIAVGETTTSPPDTIVNPPGLPGGYPYPTEIKPYVSTGEAVSIFPAAEGDTAPSPVRVGGGVWWGEDKVRLPNGGFFWLQSHFGEGGLVASPSGLVKYANNLYRTSIGENTAGPLTLESVQRMLAQPSPFPFGEPADDATPGPGNATLLPGVQWMGAGWFVIPPSAPGLAGGNLQKVTLGAFPGDAWWKTGDLPGTYADLRLEQDGIAWAATFNKKLPEVDGPIGKKNFGSEFRRLVWGATYGPSTIAPVAPSMSAAVNAAYPQLQVIVRDYFGNPVPGAVVKFVINPVDGAGAFFAGNQLVLTATTDAFGMASVSPRANNGLGAFTVTATAKLDDPQADGFTFTWEAKNAATFRLTNTGRLFAAGADAGGSPRVNVYDPQTGRLAATFLAFPASFRGGLRVAVGDVNRDGVDDILAATGAGSGIVKVIDGTKTGMVLGNGVIAPQALLASFYAFTPAFRGGLFVAAGRLGDSSRPDEVNVVAGSGTGGQVRVFRLDSGRAVRLAGPLGGFLPYGPAFQGGVRVAVGDYEGSADGRENLITAPGPSFGRLPVSVYRPDGSAVKSFYAYPAEARGGFYVAAGDLSGDGKAEIITGPGAGGGSNVRVFRGGDAVMTASFSTYPPTFSGGVRVGVLDYQGTTYLVGAAGPGPLGAVPGQKPFRRLQAIDPVLLPELTRSVKKSLPGISTDGSERITGLADAVNKLIVGMTVEGPGVPAGARVVEINSDETVTLDKKATAQAQPGLFTFETSTYRDLLFSSFLYNFDPFPGFGGGTFVGG